MAFTGTAVIEMISDSIVRITGLSLAASANGTIGLFGATGSAPGVRLPEQFNARVYSRFGNDVTLQASIDVTATPADTTSEFTGPAIVKTGTTVENWRATVTNTFGSASALLEFYVKFHE